MYRYACRHGYFHPCVVMDVAYRQQDNITTEQDSANSDTMVPVYRGNVVKPAEAAREPEVSWNSRSADDLWCLVMTGLDTHLTQVPV
jgi:large subunit ribosomal protein L38